MSWNSKVSWSEGMFLRPQHFQQQARYMENLVETRCGVLRSYAWGFTQLQIDTKLLTLGKLSISAARGVFPDGTPFNIPDDDDPPPPLDVPEDVHNTLVYLSLPTRRPGTMEVAGRVKQIGLARYLPAEDEVRDTSAGMENVAQIEVGKLSLRLLFGSDQRDEYACMGVARIVESRVDKNIILDEAFLPPLLDCQAAPTIVGFLKELQGLLHLRGESLAERVSASGRGGTAEIADFLLLQAVNRYQPLVAHLAALAGLHAESFYRTAVEIAGELATFTGQGKRPVGFPPYRHDDLQATFAPVMGELRRSLSMVLEQNAIAIPLEERKYGVRVAPILDRALLRQASFVLAVSAKISAEEIRKRFPTQAKIGPVEGIRQLVNIQLPGIGLRPLPVAPRQIPYHAGFVYFELDKNSEYWEQLHKSGGFALHLGADYPGIQLEFWAIKG